MPSANTSDTIISLHAITDVGRYRSHNEDNFVVCPNLQDKNWFLPGQPISLNKKGCLLVVADGMGGANAGEVASKIAVEAVQEQFNALDLKNDFEDVQIQEYLDLVIRGAHKAIVEASIDYPGYSGMGTTIVLAWVFPDKAHFGWCGDSRAYLFRQDGGLQLLSRDHSLVWQMVEAGEITPDEADVHPRNNIITQSLGDHRHTPKPDFAVSTLEPGDRILLCSDGLNNMINHQGIEEILQLNEGLARVNQKLVDTANENGGVDNITVVSLEVHKNNPAQKKNPAFWILSLAVFCFFLLWLFLSSYRINSTPLKRIPNEGKGQQDQRAKQNNRNHNLIIDTSEATRQKQKQYHLPANAIKLKIY